VSAVVLAQAGLYTLFSFAPALVIATGLYDAMREGAGINIRMTADRAGLVFLMTLGMCSGCAWLGIRKTRTADPVELF
jgi:putative ABC transport system permease protein